MEVKYKNRSVKEICEDSKKATAYFGGNRIMAISLFSRINAIIQAEDIKDIVVQPQMRFHKLINKGKKRLEGYFAIDVKTRRDKWRIVVELLNEKEEPFIPCNIDEIASYVKVVEIREVSDHYE